MTEAAIQQRVAESGLWSDDPDERRRRIAEALEVCRRRQAEDAAKVVYLPADRFFIDPALRGAAEWAAAAAARELGLPFTPAVRWFRQGGPHDRADDHPLGFTDRPGVAGYVQDGAPETIWLNAVYAQPGAEVAPPLAAVVAHEAEHVRQQLCGLRGRTQARERLADLTAGWLLRGEPVPR